MSSIGSLADDMLRLNGLSRSRARSGSLGRPISLIAVLSVIKNSLTPVFFAPHRLRNFTRGLLCAVQFGVNELFRGTLFANLGAAFKRCSCDAETLLIEG